MIALYIGRNFSLRTHTVACRWSVTGVAGTSCQYSVRRIVAPVHCQAVIIIPKSDPVMHRT